jgi:hypothetical protein
MTPAKQEQSNGLILSILEQVSHCSQLLSPACITACMAAELFFNATYLPIPTRLWGVVQTQLFKNVVSGLRRTLACKTLLPPLLREAFNHLQLR